MIYYKVPEKMDNVRTYKKDKAGNLIYTGFLVAKELYTLKELERAGFCEKYINERFEKKEIKKSNVFNFFGCRFEIGEDIIKA